jgi:Acyl-CoA dehydrogenase, C-terminal domain
MNADEVELLDQTLSALTQQHDGPELTAALDAFGWRELLVDEPETAISAVFGNQGASGTWSSALHDVLGAAIGVDETTAVLIPHPGTTTTCRPDGQYIAVEGLLLGSRAGPRQILGAMPTEDNRTALVRFEHSQLSLRPIYGLDPAIGAVMVSGSVDRARLEFDRIDATSTWKTAISSGRYALSHQLVGTLAAMHSLALTHAGERSQFGRQIGTFQAIRHRLAESHVAVAAARATAVGIGEVATGSGASQDDRSLAAAVAKLVAGSSAATVAAHCQQVLAGIGFTSQHPFHRFMKRASSLDRLFGNPAELSREVGHQLMLRGQAPRLLDL